MKTKIFGPRLSRVRGAVIVLVAGSALLATACSAASGNQAGNQPVAGLPGHGSGRSGLAPLTIAQSDRDMVNFARCMRAHGVQISDPFHIAGHDGLSIDLPTRDAATAAAYQACEHFLAPIEAMKSAGLAAQNATNMPALTRYARCMRTHDIPMLDPNSFGALNLGNVPGITSDFGRYSPQFRAADRACRSLLPPGVHDDGSGP